MLHLLAQDGLSLALSELLLHVGDLSLDLEHLELARDDLHHERDAFLDVEGFEDLLLVVDVRHFGGEGRGEEVGQGTWLSDVLEDAGDFLGQRGVERDQLARRFAQRVAHRVQLLVSHEGLGDPLDASLHVGLETHAGRDLEAADAAQLHGVDRGTHADDLHHAYEGSDLVQVTEGGFFYIGCFLRQNADGGTVLAERFLDESHAPGTSDVDRHHRHGEQHGIAQGQDRNDCPFGRGRRAFGHGRTLVRPPEKARVSQRLEALRSNPVPCAIDAEPLGLGGS